MTSDGRDGMECDEMDGWMDGYLGVLFFFCLWLLTCIVPLLFPGGLSWGFAHTLYRYRSLPLFFFSLGNGYSTLRACVSGGGFV